MNRLRQVEQALDSGQLHELEDRFDLEDTMNKFDLEHVPTNLLISELARRHSAFAIGVTRDGLSGPRTREITQLCGGDKLVVLGLLCRMAHYANAKLDEEETPTDRE